MPRSKSDIFADFLYRSRLTAVLKPLCAANLIVYNYHRVKPDDPRFHAEFDSTVYGVTVSEFERHVGWLSDNFRVITDVELAGIAESGKAPSGPCAMITFDDGYRDNYDLAYPILKRYGAPAVFFIPTAIIGSRRLGWWDQIAYLIKNTSAREVTVGGGRIPVEGRREEAILTLCRMMKLDDAGRTATLVEELSEACGIALPSDAAQDRELMTWQQIRELADGGMAIGSHTHTHRVLARLDRAAQREELACAKEILERETGRPVVSIAYPVGGYAHFTAETMEVARECGYRVGFSYCTGVNAWQSLSRYDVKRLSADCDVGRLAAVASLPAAFVRF
jgi:peptidoglycan/xylan/chitin deacetylase (PgdA/CDA1 family)